MTADRGSARFWIAWTAGLLAWCGALGAASRYDLALSTAVVDAQSTFGRLVRLAGEWPGWLVVAASLLVLILGRAPGGRLHAARPLAWPVILLALINPLLVTQLLKQLWGRVRFVQLAADLSDFTPFYLPSGPGAGESFPSGHVAMAFVWAPIPFFLQRRGHPVAAAVAWIVGLAYGSGVAWGRISLGAHYLTDGLFAAGVALLLAPLLVKWVSGLSSARRRSPGCAA